MEAVQEELLLDLVRNMGDCMVEAEEPIQIATIVLMEEQELFVLCGPDLPDNSHQPMLVRHKGVKNWIHTLCTC